MIHSDSAIARDQSYYLCHAIQPIITFGDRGTELCMKSAKSWVHMNLEPLPITPLSGPIMYALTQTFLGVEQVGR